MHILLASKSPRRKELLSRIFPEFEVVPPNVDEILPPKTPVCRIPELLSRRKAEALSEDYPDSLIIAADTVVIFENRCLGKPKDADDAFQMLRSLSGKAHRVITGCCIRQGGREHSFFEESLVYFYSLSDDEIIRYIETGEPMDKAGAYGIQGLGSLLVKKIEGDFYNVVGLPIARLNRELQAFR